MPYFPTADAGDAGAREETMEPYLSAVDESSAASLCRPCSLTLDSEYTELAFPAQTRHTGPSSLGLWAALPVSLGIV
jgi:hypothetical protein